MGTRKLANGKLAKSPDAPTLNPLNIPLASGVKIFISKTHVTTVMSLGFERSVVGLPIMREGFVTGTGFLQQPPTAIPGGSPKAMNPLDSRVVDLWQNQIR